MTTGECLIEAMAHLIVVEDSLVRAAEAIVLPDADWVKDDIWSIYRTLAAQRRQLVMVAREYGLDVPVYWLEYEE